MPRDLTKIFINEGNKHMGNNQRKGINLVGQTFHWLTVLQEADAFFNYFPNRPRQRVRQWLCQCVCGNQCIFIHKQLTSKNRSRKSCGCQSYITSSNRTHGKSKHPIYHLWSNIIDRTENPKTPAFKNYGARGIRFCTGWRENFENFFADIKEVPPNTTLDRINNNGGYWCGHCNECIQKAFPKNWRWATAKQQNNNRRNNRYITIDNRTLTLAQWLDISPISRSTFARRIKQGWSECSALMTPRQKPRVHFQ